MEGERQYHPLPFTGEDNDVSEFAKSVRDVPPAHYSLKIDAFSALASLLVEVGAENYDSKVFEACGYKWKLSLYPNGDKKNNGEGYISLYLVIEETDDLPPGWEVNATFKFFVYDQIQDKYLTIQDVDGKVRRFHKMKTEWGFARLLPLVAFKDATNGYLKFDKCVFGAEVFVINNSGRGECVNVLKVPATIYTWKIDKFSSLVGKQQSQVFLLGNRKWKMLFYPKGNPITKNSEFSLYIRLDDLEPSSSEKVFFKSMLRVRDQKNNNHVEKTVGRGLSSADADPSWGYHMFLSFADLHNASKGFLVNDTLIIEAEIITISTVKSLSK